MNRKDKYICKDEIIKLFKISLPINRVNQKMIGSEKLISWEELIGDSKDGFMSKISEIYNNLESHLNPEAKSSFDRDVKLGVRIEKNSKRKSYISFFMKIVTPGVIITKAAVLMIKNIISRNMKFIFHSINILSEETKNKIFIMQRFIFNIISEDIDTQLDAEELMDVLVVF